MKNTVLILALLSLSGCGLFSSEKEEIIFDDVTGPDTRALSKNLPQDLKGDAENRAYSGSRVGEGLEKKDPDGR